jgi:hypothetical protein
MTPAAERAMPSPPGPRSPRGRWWGNEGGTVSPGALTEAGGTSHLGRQRTNRLRGSALRAKAEPVARTESPSEADRVTGRASHQSPHSPQLHPAMTYSRSALRLLVNRPIAMGLRRHRVL